MKIALLGRLYDLAEDRKATLQDYIDSKKIAALDGQALVELAGRWLRPALAEQKIRTVPVPEAEELRVALLQHIQTMTAVQQAEHEAQKAQALVLPKGDTKQ